MKITGLDFQIVTEGSLSGLGGLLAIDNFRL